MKHLFICEVVFVSVRTFFFLVSVEILSLLDYCFFLWHLQGKVAVAQPCFIHKNAKIKKLTNFYELKTTMGLQIANYPFYGFGSVVTTGGQGAQ